MNQTICSLLLDNFKAKSTITDKSKQRYCDCFHKCLKFSTATSPFDVENISKAVCDSHYASKTKQQLIYIYKTILQHNYRRIKGVSQEKLDFLTKCDKQLREQVVVTSRDAKQYITWDELKAKQAEFRAKVCDDSYDKLRDLTCLVGELMTGMPILRNQDYVSTRIVSNATRIKNVPSNYIDLKTGKWVITKFKTDKAHGSRTS